jgi:hypothetical protein
MSDESPNLEPRYVLMCQFREALARLAAASEEMADAGQAFNDLGLADVPLEVARYREMAAGHRATLAKVDEMIGQYRAGAN